MQLIDDVIRTPVYGATIALVHQDSSGSVSWPRAASAVRRSLVALLLARLPFTLVGLLGSSLFASLVAHSFFGRAATALPLLLVGILSTCAEIFVALRLLFMAQVAVIEEKGALEIIPASWRRTRGQAMRLAALWVVFLLIWLVVIRRLGKPAAAPLLALAALFNEVVRTTAYLQVARTAEPSGGKTSATSA